MIYSMSMKDATSYTCEENFNIENYARILGNARRELIDIEEENS